MTDMREHIPAGERNPEENRGGERAAFSGEV
jgi:hypothetical protein